MAAVNFLIAFLRSANTTFLVHQAMCTGYVFVFLRLNTSTLVFKQVC